MIRALPESNPSLVIAKPHNKAHTATGNRIAKRLGTRFDPNGEFDIQTDLVTVEIETSATVLDALSRLQNRPGEVYIAVTNKDSVQDALTATRGSRVGIMDSYGNVVRPCGN